MAEMVLSKDYKTAVELDQRIKMTAKTFTEDFIQLCRLLDEMCSKKLYKEFGYQTFYDYCDKEIGLKPTQSKKWAKIGEGFKENGQSTVHFENLGTEKLYLLAKLDEPEREEIQQTVNLEETSVRELKAEIAKLKDDNDKIRSAKISMESDLLSVKSNNRSLRHQLDDAEKKIADLESRPVEIAVQEDEEGKIAKALVKELDRKLSEADQDHVNEVQKIRREYQNQINELSRQLTEMTEQAETKQVIEKVDNTAVFDVYVKMIDKIIFSMQAHIANDVQNFQLYKDKINELITGLEAISN